MKVVIKFVTFCLLVGAVYGQLDRYHEEEEKALKCSFTLSVKCSKPKPNEKSISANTTNNFIESEGVTEEVECPENNDKYDYVCGTWNYTKSADQNKDCPLQITKLAGCAAKNRTYYGVWTNGPPVTRTQVIVTQNFLPAHNSLAYLIHTLDDDVAITIQACNEDYCNTSNFIGGKYWVTFLLPVTIMAKFYF